MAKIRLRDSKKNGGRYSHIKRENGFRSNFENNINNNIDSKYKGYIFYETENIDYIIEHKYKPDFIIENKETGKKIYIEAKGLFNSDDRRKILAVLKCNPNIDLRIIFQNGNNKIRKGSKKTYIDWCNDNNIKCTEAECIPKKWIEEIF